MIPIAIFASGRGSNFEAIAENVRSGALSAEIVALVTDRPAAPVAATAAKLGYRVIAIPPETGGSKPLIERRRAHEEKVLHELLPLKPRFLVMAGYMRIVTETLLSPFRSDQGYARVVNIHPSLLPSFPGANAYDQAFLHGVKVSGVTIHLVDEGVDQGPILAQEAFSLDGCATAADVEARGLKIERRFYSETLRWVLPERFQVTAGASAPERRLIVNSN